MRYSPADEIRDLKSRLEKYGQHLPDCEMVSPSKGLQYIGGGLYREWLGKHVCGLQGYNPMIDDPCPGCDGKSVERHLRCTCGWLR